MGRQRSLWTRRIQASSLGSAREYAIHMIREMGNDYGELQILWDDADVYTAPGLRNESCYRERSAT